MPIKGGIAVVGADVPRLPALHPDVDGRADDGNSGNQ
jgi:hypothetical protein